MEHRTSSEKLSEINDFTRAMTRSNRDQFDSLLIGALSVSASDEAWYSAVKTAKNLMAAASDDYQEKGRLEAKI